MNSFEDIWQVVLEELKEENNQVMFNLYASSLVLLRYESDTLFFQTDKDFKKRVIDEKFIEPMKEKFEKYLGFPVEIDVAAKEEETAEPEIEENESISISTQEKLVSHFTFDNFVTCDENQFAYNVSKAAAENPGTKYNPVFIYGDSGLGKSHLLFASYQKMKEKNPEARILQTSGQKFMHDFFDSIRMKTNVEFHNTYRDADALFIDDIQFIDRGGVSLQEEIFYLFENLFNAGKQIYIISDRPPREISTLSDRLRSRFESGIIVDIQPPDKDTRIVIIQSKAKEHGFEIPTETAEFIAERIKTNIRQIEGVVKKMDAIITINKKMPTLEEINDIVNVVSNNNQPNDVIVAKILERVANDTQVSITDIKSKKRDKAIKDARQISIYIIKQKTTMTLKEIGEIFSLSHSTVLHSIEQVENEKGNRPSLKLLLDSIVNDI